MIWFWLTVSAALLWSVINVGNSTLVERFRQTPSFQLWVQTAFSMVALAAVALFYDISTPWAPILFIFSVLAYLGDLFFFRVLKVLDVSVVNAAWAILAIFLSIAGFLFFEEVWTPLQFAGASLVIAGVLLLSFFHVHVSLPKTLGMLTLLAILYVPGYTARKAALLAGEPLLPVVFWIILGRDLFAFLVPLGFPSQRRDVLRSVRACPPVFFALSFLVIASFYLAEYLVAWAYASGPLSLIAVTGNVQPFFVIFLAGVLARFAPSLAPKELFSIRSTGIKLLSFLIVFLGLALLGTSQ